MHKRRRSSWKIHSWSTPTSWVRETWNAFLKKRGQMSSPCPPLQPGRRLPSSILSTKASSITAPCIGWWRTAWTLALRTMRPQWCLWVLPTACSASTAADSWRSAVHSFWHFCCISSDHSVSVFSRYFLEDKNPKGRDMQLPRAGSGWMCWNGCSVCGQGWWGRCSSTDVT